MCTYLGASVDLGPEDVDPAQVASAAVTYLEGYLWDKPRAKEAFRLAMGIAHRAGRTVSLTLSDSMCVERHREELLTLVDNEVDLLFANQHEIMSLYQVPDLESAVAAVRGRGEAAVITRSELGSLVVTADAVHEVPATPVEHPVDTTGAGDLFAAGFLHGLTHGHAAARVRAPRAASPPPRSSPTSAPARRSGSRTSPGSPRPERAGRWPAARRW